MSACVAPATRKTAGGEVTVVNPMSDLSVVKGLNLEVPAGAKKAAESFMVAVVMPQYEFGETGAKGRPKKSDQVKKIYIDQVKKTLKEDMDYMLLQKGIRVLGPFPTHDEMTFDDKKRAIYALVPKINLAVIEQNQIQESDAVYNERGSFAVTGRITLELWESITKEKLWVKRIEAPNISKPYSIVKDTYTENVQKRRGGKVTLGDLLVGGMVQRAEEKDDSDMALGYALSEFYKPLGRKLWDHIDPEEWEKYLSQASALRKEKRY